MCDRDDLASFDKLSRRGFGVLGGAAALAACTSMEAAAGGGDLAESMVPIPTQDGTMDAFFVHPAGDSRPAVIIWPDIAGLRDAFKTMARRLARSGYAVLLTNPYYRSVPAPQFADFAEFRSQDGFQKVGPWREQLTAEAIMRDARSLVTWLDAQEAVDSDSGIGTQGYCMGGPFTIWTAAAVPSRVRAAASFHGGGLVREGASSPHRLLGQTRANFLIAIAEGDDAKEPEAKNEFRRAAEAAGRPAEVEVYPAEHGWTVYDSPVYEQAPAERAWARLLALYETAL